MKPRAVLVLVLVAFAIAIPHVVGSQTLADKVKEFQLRNGMKFIVVERPTAPVFFAAITFNVGSSNEVNGSTGISHFLEHMMFKGTRKIGTTSYDREKGYLKEEDEIAASIAAKRREIGAWRLEIFDGFARDVVASFPDEVKQAIGSDRTKETEALIDVLQAGQRLPEEAERYPVLLREDQVDYLNKYAESKQLELELARVQDKHKEVIIEEEFWDIYTREGGRMINAFTSDDITAYIVYLPSNRLELWMSVEADRLANPVFREAYQERDVIAEELRLGENDPEEALWDAFMAAAFEASPYGRSVVGWMSDIQNLTRGDLEAHYRRYYAPNNAVVILAGDVDVDVVEDMARTYFDDIPAQEPLPPLITREPEQLGERRVTVEHTANPQVMIGYHVPAAPHPDYYALQVLIAVLGQGPTSRLYPIYEAKQITASSPEVYTGPGDKLDNLLIIGAAPRHPHSAEEVEEAIYSELEAIKSKPPTDYEMQRVRNKIDADMVRTLGSNMGIVFNLGFAATIRGDWRTYLSDIEKVKQVTAEDVSRVASKYLTSKNRTVATLVKVEEDGNAEGNGAPPAESKDGSPPPATKAKAESPQAGTTVKAKSAQPAAIVKQDRGEPEVEEVDEEVDLQEVLEYVRTLDEAEQREISEKVQRMSQEEAKQLLKELSQRMKAAQEKEAKREN
jgi:predicted Zn-dependent peptidase